MSENNVEQVYSEEVFNTEDLMRENELQNTDEIITNTEEQSEMNIDENKQENDESENMNLQVGEDSNDGEQEEHEKETNEDEEEEQGKENVTTTKKKTMTNTQQNRLTELPLAKIKHIVKLDPEVKLVSGEAIFVITKSTELFIKALTKESFGFAAQNKKKTISKTHVDKALEMLPIEL